MDRRRFLLTSLVATITTPLAVLAQSLPRAAVFIGSPGQYTRFEEAFVQGMHDNGYMNRQHFALEVRYAETAGGELDRVTREVLESRPDVLVTMGSQGAWAAKKATTSTPVVMAILADPVSQGLVQSLAHPGGNLTGNAILTEVVTQKRLQLLHELLPKARRIGVVENSANPSFPFVWNGVESAAKHSGLTLLRIDVPSPSAVDEALGEIARQRPDAVMVGRDIVLYLTRLKTIDFMAQNKIPAVFAWKEGVLDELCE